MPKRVRKWKIEGKFTEEDYPKYFIESLESDIKNLIKEEMSHAEIEYLKIRRVKEGK